MDISSRPSYVEASVSSSLASASSFAEKCQGLVQHLPAHRRLVEPVLTPRFVPTCSNELLKGLGKLSEERSLRIQSHLAEAEDQVKWVRGERGTEDIDVFSQVRVVVTGTEEPDDAHAVYRQTCSLRAPSKHTAPTLMVQTWALYTKPERPSRIVRYQISTFPRVRSNSARLCRPKFWSG